MTLTQYQDSRHDHSLQHQTSIAEGHFVASVDAMWLSLDECCCSRSHCSSCTSSSYFSCCCCSRLCGCAPCLDSFIKLAGATAIAISVGHRCVRTQRSAAGNAKDKKGERKQNRENKLEIILDKRQASGWQGAWQATRAVRTRYA